LFSLQFGPSTDALLGNNESVAKICSDEKKQEAHFPQWFELHVDNATSVRTFTAADIRCNDVASPSLIERMPATTVTWLFGVVCFQPIAADADAASSVEDEGPL
jgi:hypothetical protein